MTKQNEAFKSHYLQSLPDFVVEAIASIPEHYTSFGAISLIKVKVEEYREENEDWVSIYNWLTDDIKNQDVFALAFIDDKYRVEKNVPVTEKQYHINPELMDLVKLADSATFEIPEVAVPFTAVMNPEILKAYSDGNTQGYHQGFQDGKKKGSIMHDDGTVSFEDYTPDEALERAVESALNDNSENIPELSNRESYRLGVYALKEWYEELK